MQAIWDKMTEAQRTRFNVTRVFGTAANYSVICRQCEKLIVESTTDPVGCMEEHTSQSDCRVVQVTDRRGQEPVGEACRVCGAPECHSREYNRPTMQCVEYLRNRPAAKAEVTAHAVSRWINANKQDLAVIVLGDPDKVCAVDASIYATQDKVILLKVKPVRS